MRARFAVLFFNLILLGAAVAQPLLHARQQPQPDEPLKLSADLVLLDAQVVNKRTGQAVGGLTREDFLLYEDGVRQHITHFSKDRLPISILILLDVSGSVWPVIKKLKEGALESLRQLKPEDEVALMAFAGNTKIVQGFTRDRRVIVDNLLSTGGRDLEGGTNQNEAIYQAATFLTRASNPDSRRVIIAITDDVSTLERFVPHTQQQTLYQLLESGSVVCGLFYESLATTDAPVSLDAITVRGIRATTGVVKGYVERTAGVAIKTDTENIKERFNELIERLRSRYTLGYQPASPRQKGKFRRIKLQVSPDIEKREGPVSIKTRKGY